MKKWVLSGVITALFIAVPVFVHSDDGGSHGMMAGHGHEKSAGHDSTDKCLLCGTTGEVTVKNTKNGVQISIKAKGKDKILEIQEMAQEWLKMREKMAAHAAVSGTAKTGEAVESKMDGNPDEIVYCPVMGTKMKKKDAYAVYEYKGKKYYLCCGMCVDPFRNNPEKYVK